MGLYNFIWIKHVVSDTNIFFDTCLREKKISKEGPAKKCFSQHEGTNIAVTLFILWITVTALPLLFTHTHQRSNVYTLSAQSTQVYYTYTLTSLNFDMAGTPLLLIHRVYRGVNYYDQLLINSFYIVPLNECHFRWSRNIRENLFA